MRICEPVYDLPTARAMALYAQQLTEPEHQDLRPELASVFQDFRSFMIFHQAEDLVVEGSTQA